MSPENNHPKTTAVSHTDWALYFLIGSLGKKSQIVLFIIVIMFTDMTIQTVPVCPSSFLLYETAVSSDVCFLFHFFHLILQTSSTGLICVFHSLWNHATHNLGIKPSTKAEDHIPHSFCSQILNFVCILMAWGLSEKLTEITDFFLRILSSLYSSLNLDVIFPHLFLFALCKE